MVEALTHENDLSHEQSLIADLTETAVRALDAYAGEFKTNEDGMQVRHASSPVQHSAEITETKSPDGLSSFTYVSPVIVVALGGEGVKTTHWEEGASTLDLTYEMKKTGRHSVSTNDASQISYYTHTYLKSAFPLPEKDLYEPPKLFAKLRAFLGQLSSGRNQPLNQ